MLEVSLQASGYLSVELWLGQWNEQETLADAEGRKAGECPAQSDCNTLRGRVNLEDLDDHRQDASHQRVEEEHGDLGHRVVPEEHRCGVGEGHDSYRVDQQELSGAFVSQIKSEADGDD